MIILGLTFNIDWQFMEKGTYYTSFDLVPFGFSYLYIHELERDKLCSHAYYFFLFFYVLTVTRSDGIVSDGDPDPFRSDDGYE